VAPALPPPGAFLPDRFSPPGHSALRSPGGGQ
jgi:hypothetical protein